MAGAIVLLAASDVDTPLVCVYVCLGVGSLLLRRAEAIIRNSSQCRHAKIEVRPVPFLDPVHKLID